MSHLLYVYLYSFHAQREPGPTQVAHCPFLMQETQCSANNQQVVIPVMKSLCFGVTCHDNCGGEIFIYMKISALKLIPAAFVSSARTWAEMQSYLAESPSQIIILFFDQQV